MDGDEYSSECEEQPQGAEAPAVRNKQTGIRTIEEVDETEEKPKKKRNISEAARKTMIANLAKARAALAAKKEREAKARRISQYPKSKRNRAKEMMEEDIQREADRKLRLLAEETLRKKKEEEEFLEFKKWRESVGNGKTSPPPPPPPPPPPKKAKTKGKKSVPFADVHQNNKIAPKPRRKSENSQPAQIRDEAVPWFSTRTASFNIDDFIG